MDLTGKRVLITAAGQGIGFTTARLFAAAGAEVIASDINLERLQATICEASCGGAACTASGAAHRPSASNKAETEFFNGRYPFNNAAGKGLIRRPV